MNIFIKENTQVIMKKIRRTENTTLDKYDGAHFSLSLLVS